MPYLLWDASALAKRCTEETESKTVQALFASVALAQMITTIWGYAESFSILLRRHNGGVISAKAFAKAASALENELIFDPATIVLTIDDAAVLSSIAMMKKHNLNSTDAAILTIFLRYLAVDGITSCALVSADKRLNRAAEAAGITAIDPETLAEADVPALLTSL